MPEVNGDSPNSNRRKATPIDYPPNSHKSHEEKATRPGVKKPAERVKQEKVVTGSVIQRKKSLGSKIKEMFTGDDARSVGEYLVQEVFVPALKSLLSDVASQGAERLLYGESNRTSSRGGRSGSRSNFTNYSRMHDRPEPRRDISHQNRASHDFRDIVLETRPEAEDVLERLGDLIDQYDVANVGDLYDLVGITPDFTDNNYGWYDMRGSRIIRTRDGYLLDLPKTEHIE